MPDPVAQSHTLDGPALFQFIKKQVKLVLGHFVERLILNGNNGGLVFCPAHEADEINDRAHVGRKLPPAQQRGLIDLFSAKCQFASHLTDSAVYPPCTGGNSDTSSASLRRY